MLRSHTKRVLGCALALISFVVAAPQGQAFTHPGLLNSAADLSRDKAGIAAGTEPWRSAWERLQNSKIPGVSGTYTASPLATVTDTGSRSAAILDDSEAAYYNAIEWYMTGNKKYATTAINIMNAWASTCTLINGSNAQLAANIDFFDMVNAAEIIRYSGAGWNTANIKIFENFLTNTIYPVVSPSGYDSWGGGSNTMMMMIGVFNNNHTIYNRGYNNFVGTNSALACLTGLYDPSSVSFGQSADSWRDQGHPQLGLDIGLSAAEIALNSSGQNLFTFDNNLLLAATEYSAKYNLGHGVTWDNTFGTAPTAISSASRGRFWPIYALALSGFQRSGLTAPYTSQVVAAEGVESSTDQGGGLGTLLYSQGTTARPIPQYALLAYESPSGYLMAGSNGASAITAASPCIRSLETYQEVILGNGYSAFKSVANGLYLTTSGTSAVTASSSTDTSTQQEFKVVDMGNITYQFYSAVNDLALTLQSNGTIIPSASGIENQFSAYAVGTTVPSVVTALSGNTYKIINGRSGYAVNVSGASTAEGAVVNQWAYGAETNQEWIFTNTGNGFYTIKNANSGLVLDVANASQEQGVNIDQWASTGGVNQSWVPEYVNYADGTGAFNLYSANGPIYLNLLEVPGSSTTQGTQLDQWGPNGGLNQQWTIASP